jgi:hypothetical protein
LDYSHNRKREAWDREGVISHEATKSSQNKIINTTNKSQFKMSTRTRKAVSFSPNVESKRIPNDSCWTQRERDAVLWYSPEEMTDIWVHCKQVATGKVAGEPLRGLELIGSNTEFLSKRKDIIRQVLHEQERQRWSVGRVDPEALAEVERNASEYRQRIARLRAVQDAQVANGYKKQEVAPSDTSQIRERRRSARRSIRRDRTIAPSA